MNSAKLQTKNYKLKAKQIKPLTGGYAAAEFLRQLDPEVMAVYPITPQTPIIEAFAKMRADGEVDTEMIPVESEHSAMSAAIGASACGVRSVTATSSQGLALMHEMLYIASGLRLPIFMYVSARALSAPLNIHGDHSDVMGSRDAGWIQIFSENAQEAYDNGFIAVKLAEKVKLPVMVVMDGFHTSHTTERMEMYSDAAAKNFLGEYQAEQSLFDFDNPPSFGTLALQNSYFEFKIDQEKAFGEALAEYPNVCREFEKSFGPARNATPARSDAAHSGEHSVAGGGKYGYFEEYKLEDAESAIVVMGSTAGTIKDAVDEMRAEGKKVGLLKIKLFRPFPHKETAKALAHVKNIAVLDRAISMGTYPPLFQEILRSTYNVSSIEKMQSYIYGLGGRETTKEQIIEVFDELKNKGDGDIKEKTNYIK